MHAANLLSITKSVATGADFWMGVYHTNRDASSLKNASFALGRVCVIGDICTNCYPGSTDPIVLEILAIVNKYTKIWIEQINAGDCIRQYPASV